MAKSLVSMNSQPSGPDLEPWNPDRWLVPLAWLGCWLACPSLLLAWTPGILLVPRRPLDQRDPLVRGVEIVGASLCFWAVGFWFLRFIPAPLETFFYACSAFSVAAHTAWPRTGPHAPLRERLGQIPIAGLLAATAVVLLRLLPMNTSPAPAGADMSMHTYLIEMIVQAGGVPASYRPILPIDTFATFPVGFHVPGALISITEGLPSYRAGFEMTALTHAFTSFAFFALFRVHAAALPAAITAFAASFVGEAPQGYIAWGGNPTVLGIALFALLASRLLRFRQWRPADAALAGLFLAGVAATHTLVLVQGFYLLGLPLLAWLAARGPHSPATLRNLLIFGGVFGVALAPYLSSLDFGAVTPEVEAWIRNWVSNHNDAWGGNPSTSFLTIPTYALESVRGNIIVLLPFLAFGLAPLRRRDPMAWALQLAFLFMAFVLILNTELWWLPLSALVYPERVAAMSILPLGVLAAVGLEGLLAPTRLRGGFAAGWVVAFAIVLAASPYDHYLRISSESGALREADLRALAWLDARAAPGDVVETQYADAGLWIPAVLFRPITEAHLNIAYLTTTEMPSSGRFLYIGSHCVGECPWSVETPPDPAIWQEIHRDRDARIYERRAAEETSP